MFSKLLTKHFNVRQRHIQHPTTRVGVLGVPVYAGVFQKDRISAASLLKEHKLIKYLKEIHDRMDVVDYGDFEYEAKENLPENIPENMTNYYSVIQLCKYLSERCKAIVRDGRKFLIIGGDHALAIGTVHGHIRGMRDHRQVALLWIDAYPNINTNLTSDSGNISGMPVAILAKDMKDYWPSLPNMDWYEPVLPIRNIAYIGIRDVDPFERLTIDKFGIPAYGIKDIERYGIDVMTEMALKHVDPFENRSIHVSFSIAALDKLEAPSTDSAIRGGLKLRECLHIMEIIHATGRLGGMDLVEMNPDVGDEKDLLTTVEAANLLCQSAFGGQRKGQLPSDTRLKQFRPALESEL